MYQWLIVHENNDAWPLQSAFTAVDILNVTIAMCFSREFCFTMRAFKWFFTGVRPHVFFEIALGEARVLAYFTLEIFLLLVNLTIVLSEVHKTFPTLRTEPLWLLDLGWLPQHEVDDLVVVDCFLPTVE